VEADDEGLLKEITVGGGEIGDIDVVDKEDFGV